MTKNEIKNKIKSLKEASGSHSPSIATMLREVPQLKITTDACFLSNPYATDLFMDYLQKDLISTNKLRSVLEFYPPQNKEVAKSIASVTGLSEQLIFVGNGAIEIIQAIIHRFCSRKICVILPSFSSYYEYVMPGVELVFYQLKKENDYLLNKQDYIQFIAEHKPDMVVLINPNNPNGCYINKNDLREIVDALHFVNNIIIDESFVHFAYEDEKHELVTYDSWVEKYTNVILVKSMSKDFGVAGLRAGYGVMRAEKVATLLSNGYLWNVSGLADYFFTTYSNPIFYAKYETERLKYLQHTAAFYTQLKNIGGIKVLPSSANFFLIELLDEHITSFDFSMDLLVDHEVYVRDCSDKIGLDGKYVRIASRTQEENNIIAQAINAVLNP